MLRFECKATLKRLTSLPMQLRRLKESRLRTIGDVLAKEIQGTLVKGPNGFWRSTGTPKPSKPGTPPGIVSGNLQFSVDAELRQGDLFVGVPQRSDGWYAKIHEQGGDLAAVGPVSREIKIRKDLQTRIYQRGKRKGQSNERHSFQAYVESLRSNRDRRTGASLITDMQFDKAKGTITVTRRPYTLKNGQPSAFHQKTRTYKNSRTYPARPFVRPVIERNRARIREMFRPLLERGLAA